MRELAIVEAPSVLGLRPSGVQDLPAALLGAGLRDLPGAVAAGRVDAPPYDPRRDPETGVLNPHGIVRYAVSLADVVGAVLARGSFPVVLGGDCSILLGNLLALRRRGRYGLLFVDGHTDFYQPTAEPTGEAASMDLALATGRGTSGAHRHRGPWAAGAGRGCRSLRLPRRRGVDGGRDAAVAAATAHDRSRPGARSRCGRGGPAGGRLAGSAGGTCGYWVHLDVDVLDDAVMPAVDYRLPGGLTWAELGTVLRTAMSGGRAVGLDVTIFNPRLDPDGQIAAHLAGCLRQGLSVLTDPV